LQEEIASPDEDEGDSEWETAGQEKLPLNTIFYGPPGTGKTWATFRRCVEICDGETPDDREEIRTRYQQLLNEERVEFVTFHQSYGYEDFVEGIRPISDADTGGGLQLAVKDGVLKRVAERARRPYASSESRQVFKMVLPDEVFVECIDNGYTLLDRGGDIDWSDARFKSSAEIFKHWQSEVNPNVTSGRHPPLLAMCYLRAEMQPGDILVVANRLRKFRAVGVITGCYEYQRREDGFHHRRAVDWHWHVREKAGESVYIFQDYQFARLPIHRITLSKPTGLLRYLKGSDDLGLPKPHVLVSTRSTGPTFPG